ncbi:MAG TPA: thiamine diphosphokinase [Clostridiales bacterium]|nr:thiamine diphosphokinase [Clostridiales bacterium]
MKCLIISNGTIEDYHWLENEVKRHDYILSVDGGTRHLYKIHQIPHAIVGDLDSIPEEMIRYYKERNVEIYQFPVRKDYTDTEIAVEHAISKNADKITIIGGIGNRLDHTLANIALLIPLVDKGIDARIVNEYNEIIAVNQDIELEGEVGEQISILPYCTTVEGLTLKGFEYPLYDAKIDIGSSIGISNRFIQPKASISIKKGYILVIRSRE